MAVVQPLILRSFAGGELSPSVSARADVSKFVIGLRTCRNWIVQRHGSVTNRSGTRYINECKTNDDEVRLLTYVATDPGDSVLIEFGDLYMRFYYQEGLVAVLTSSVTAYNGATAYVEGDLQLTAGTVYYCRLAVTGTAAPNATYWYALPQSGTGSIVEVPHIFATPLEVKVSQSGTVMTFTHEDHNPYDLVFVSLTTWRMKKVTTTPQVTPPQSLVFTTPGTGVRKFGYRVTAAHPETYEESEPSAAVVNITAATPTVDAPHKVTWTALTIGGLACLEYYVYCDPYGNGTYGYIGTATGAAFFFNPGLLPDYSQTPPIARDLFEGASNEFPRANGYYQQRRWFAHFPSGADTIAGSRVGFESNFGVSSPLQDDDAITARIAGNNHHAIQWLVALKNLILMTDGGEWRMIGAGGILAPNTIGFDQETYVGADPTVAPVVIGNNIIYVQARGAIVRDVKFDVQVEGLAGRDLTSFANHLFDGYTLQSAAYQQTPESIVWFVRSDGTLLGLTYLHEQDMWAWHRHDTDGQFDSVAVVPEPGEDALYCIVRRVIQNVVVRYIERMEPRTILSPSTEGVFLDSALAYSGTAITSASGLGHLEGKTVGMVGDGVDLGTAVVTSGSVALGASATYVVVGLPITADIETLELDAHGTEVRDKLKRVQALSVLLYVSSRSFKAGPDVNHLTRYTIPSTDTREKNFTGAVELAVISTHRKPGRVFLRQDAPLPITILGLIPQVEIAP